MAEKVILLESESRDEHLGSWRENVRNGIDRLYARLPYLEAGGMKSPLRQ